MMHFMLLSQAHKDFTDSRVSVFVCDLTIDDLSKQISSSSVDIVTMVYEWNIWIPIVYISLIDKCSYT